MRMQQCLAAFLLCATPSFASDPGMQAANQVSEASYRAILGDDQGAFGILYTHDGHSRGVSGAQHDLARTNIFNEFQSYGLAVTLEPFQYSGNTYFNVVATQLGTALPNEQYIIGAHYDSVSNPGADDNASGVALVLEAARIVSQMSSARTIKYIAFDREEQGLVGSSAYVLDHLGDDVRGMISTDMVAYNTGVNSADLHCGAGSAGLQTALSQAVGLYGIDLGYALLGATSNSDHAPFEAAGYQACLLIEDWGNPNYHTQQDSVDTPNYIDHAYAVKMTRSIVGFLVDEAVIVNTLLFTYPNSLPRFVDPYGGDVIRVEIVGIGDKILDPATATFHFDIGAGWQSVPMSAVTATEFQAVMPAAGCASEIAYYFSARSTDGALFTDPNDAPQSAYFSIAGLDLELLFHDSFEQTLGWTAQNLGATTGDWQQGVPVNDPGWAYDPISDSDGSGQCWLTENQFGNTDVDNGAVQLTSPTLDLSSADRIAYDYFLMLTNTSGAVDRLLVELFDGQNWREVALHTDSGGIQWQNHEIDLAGTNITMTPAMQLRFIANDANPQSIVEAGLDAFKVLRVVCCPGPDGDLDGSRTTDGADIQFLVDAVLGTATRDQLCHGDFDQNEVLDVGDVPGFVIALLGP